MREKRLNVKLVVWTAACLLLAGAGVHWLHAYQVGREADDFIGEAARAERRGRPDQAANALGRYLALRPGDVEIRARYALLLDRQAATPAARWRVVSLFQEVLLRNPGRADIRRRLIDRALAMGHFSLAEKHLQILLRTRPGDAELIDLLAQCREGTGRLGEAAAGYEKAIQLAPHRIASYRRLAELLRHRLGQPTRAREVMDALVRANPDDVEALLVRAHSLLTYTSLNGAGQDLARARRLAPDRADVLEDSAHLAQLRGHLAEARGYWQRGLEQHPRDRRMYLGLAGLELQAGRPRSAIACLRRGLEKLPDDPDLLFTLADVHIQQGELAKARRVMARLEKGNSPAAAAAYLRGRLLMRQRRWLSAARELEATQTGDITGPLMARIYLYLGECYARLGYADGQLAALRNAAALDPSSQAARMRLGAALLALGKSEEALEVFQEITRRPLAPGASWTYLARARLQRVLHLPFAQRDWEEIGADLDRAGQSADQAAPAAVLRAETLLARNRPWEAGTLLDEALDKKPKEVSLWVARTRLALRQGDPEKARQVLEEARAQLGDRLELRLAWADYWGEEGGPEAARGLRDLEKGLDRFSPEEQVQLLRRLAQGQARLGQLARAKHLYQVLLDRNPEDLDSRALLLDLVLETGPEGAVRRAIAGLKTVEGDTGVWWRWGEAARLIVRARRGDKQGLPQAVTLLKEVEAKLPGWSRVPLLEGYLKELEGRPEQALDCYLRAIALGNRELPAISRAVQLLAERGRFSEADQVVRTYQEQVFLGPVFARVAALIALRAGDAGRAAELARQAVPPGSRDYRDYLWLGEMLAAAGEPGEAARAFRRATEVGPGIPDARVALVRFLARTNQRHKAEEALEELPYTLSPDEVPFALAQGYEAMGWAERAGKRYRAALGQRPRDFLVLARAAQFYLRTNQPSPALPLLRTLLESGVTVPVPTRAWARRQLALILASEGKVEGNRQALALLDQNRTSAGPSPIDERTRAFVRAALPGKRAEALQELEELHEKETFPPDEEFRLALLYEAEDNWPRARVLFLSTLTGDPNNPAYLEHYVQALLRRGLREEARSWLGRLEILEPDSPRTRRLRIQVEKAGGRE